MVGLKEVQIQRQILDFLTIKGVFHWRANQVRVPGRSFNGLPGCADILAVIPPFGKLLAIEVKTKNGKQSQDQMAFQELCEQNGALYVVIRNIDEMVDFYDKLVKEKI